MPTPDIETVRVILPAQKVVKIDASLSQSIVAVRVGNLRSVVVSAFTLNGTTNSVSLIAGGGISLSANASRITISNTGSIDPNVVSAIGILGHLSTGSITLIQATNMSLITTPNQIAFSALAATQSISAAGVSITGTAVSLDLEASSGISLITSSGLNALSVTVSNLNPYPGIEATMAGNTLGTASTLLAIDDHFSLSGAGIVSVGAFGQILTISATTPSVTNYSSIRATMTGSTLGTASTTLTIGSSLSVSGMGACSVGASGGTLSISVPLGAGGTGFSTITGTMTGNTLGVSSTTITIANSFSLSGAGIISVGGSGGTITISATTPSVVSSLNGSTGSISISAGAGIGIGQSSSTITVSASVQTSSITASVSGNTLNSNSATGTYSNSLVIDAQGIISAEMSTSGNTLVLSATTPSVTNFSTITATLVGNVGGASTTATIANGLLLSAAGALSISGSGGTITVSSPVGTNFSTISLSASGNTTSSSSGTMNNVLAFSGAGVASVGVGNGSVTISVPGGLGGAFSLNGSTASVSLVAGNGIAFSTNNSSLTISVDTTATNFSLNGSSSSVSLVAGAGIGFSSSNSTITVSAIAPNANKILMTQNVDLALAVGTVVSKGGTITGTAGVGSSLFLERIFLYAPITVTEYDAAMSIAFQATGNGAGTMTRSLGIYSFGNNTSLALVTSVSLSQAWTTGTITAGASVSLTQFQGGWSTPLIQPMTLASFSLSPGDYVVGRLFDFAQVNSTWTINLYGQLAGGNINSSSLSSIVQATNVIGFVAFQVAANSNFIVSSGLSTLRYVSMSAATSTNFNSTTQTTAASLSGSQIVAWSTTPTVVALPGGGTQAVTGLGGVNTNIAVITAISNTTIPNFGYIGTASTTSGFPTIFSKGIMSTGSIPASIAVTSSAVTYSGSAAFQQPWYALVGS